MSRIHLLPETKRGVDTIWADYNEINPLDSESERKAKLEQWIGKRIGTKLMEVYNQREWKVMVDIDNRMLIIGCDSICNYKGYHIKMAGRTIQELIDRSIMAAGEILERHNLARSRNFDPAQLDDLARDAKDSVISPDAAPEPI
jgi:hypothetical protein